MNSLALGYKKKQSDTSITIELGRDMNNLNLLKFIGEKESALGSTRAARPWCSTIYFLKIQGALTAGRYLNQHNVQLRFIERCRTSNLPNFLKSLLLL